MLRVCDMEAMDAARAKVGVPLALLMNTSGASIYVTAATILLASMQGIQFHITHYLVLG